MRLEWKQYGDGDENVKDGNRHDMAMRPRTVWEWGMRMVRGGVGNRNGTGWRLGTVQEWEWQGSEYELDRD